MSFSGNRLRSGAVAGDPVQEGGSADGLRAPKCSLSSPYPLPSYNLQPMLRTGPRSLNWESGKSNGACRSQGQGAGPQGGRGAAGDQGVSSLVGSWSCHLCWELLKEKASAFGCQA